MGGFKNIFLKPPILFLRMSNYLHYLLNQQPFQVLLNIITTRKKMMGNNLFC